MDRQLIDYLPEIDKTYQEFIDICDVEQHFKENLWDDLNNMFAQGFIQDEGDYGASRWEKTLNIIPKDTDSLELRNFRITGRIQQDLPYTLRTLKKQLEALCGNSGYVVDLQYDAFICNIKVALKNKELKDAIADLADNVVPVHLILNVSLLYNTHKMIADSGKTHQELQAYTYGQLREEPFED